MKNMTGNLYFSKPLKLLLISLLALSCFGCKPKLLPSSNVRATRENTEIYDFLEAYKTALEKRSVDDVMQLVAMDFRDNMGSDKPELQMDYLKLKERLEKYFPRIKELRVGLFLQHIKKIEKGTYEVVFYFSESALTDLPAGEKWLSKKEVNRMVIRKTTDRNAPYPFEIIKGI